VFSVLFKLQHSRSCRLATPRSMKIPDRTPHPSRSARHPLPMGEGGVPPRFASLSLGERVPDEGGWVRGHFHASG
jgi:hypothetical protein